MRVFLAGATGVIGVRLLPLLLAEGHAVAGLTRSQPDVVAALGGEPVVCDVYDLDALREAVRAFAPDLVLHELTDLPDEPERLQASLAANARIRDEGTRNLLDAAAGVRMLAQSIAFPAGAGSVAGGPGAPEHERLVLDGGGVVLRYGRFYGPGTYHEDDLPPPRIHVDDAARRTVELLDAPAGTVVEIAEDA